jgi:hypothetical protein
MTGARPSADEYGSYYERYVGLVPDGDIVQYLTTQLDETISFLTRLGEEKPGHRYDEGKWSIKQIVGHLTDVERVFAYRALCFARGESTPQPSFDENDYVQNANFDDRSWHELVVDYRMVRLAVIALFRSFDGEIMMRTGTASGCDFTVRAVAFILAGHLIHHRRIIDTRYLREKP